MTLGEKQRLFPRLLHKLWAKAWELGYEFTTGDAFRDPRSHGAVGVQGVYGAPSSCHKLKLALDMNLFKDGVFLQKTEDHKPLGEYWESLHPDCRWGGRFNDGNHYSITHNGMK